MKTIYLFPLLLLIFITACKKDSSNNSNPTPAPSTPSYYFKCKVDGTDWSAITPQGVDTNLLGAAGFVVRDGNAAGGGVTNHLSIGVIDLGSGLVGLNDAVWIDASFNLYEYAAGTPIQLTLSTDSVNKVISGTFTFKMVDGFNNDTIQISAGQYKVPY